MNEITVEPEIGTSIRTPGYGRLSDEGRVWTREANSTLASFWRCLEDGDTASWGYLFKYHRPLVLA